ncbi:prophage tail fiber N-terminal domain-containing protein, partial [Salmonella enterica]|nr:prophage tail fiber N-terminal domain-containing protein [Salmonella enterica]
MSQRKIQLQGTLTTVTGNSLPNTTLSLSEIDSHQVIMFTTDSTAGYNISVPEGTWKVTVQPPQSPPRMTGVLAVTAATQGGALSDLLTALSPSSLDMSVLSFMRGLVDEAERATEALNIWREVIDQNVKKSLDAVALTQQAVKEAHEIVGNGRPGRDGQSAYEIWASQQPAGTDATMSAWMEYSKGTPGEPGAD